MYMMYFRNIPCCSIIRTNHLSEPPLVLISSDNRRSTVFSINPQLTEKNACIFYRWGPLDPNYVIFEKSLDYLQIYFSLVQMP